MVWNVSLKICLFPLNALKENMVTREKAGQRKGLKTHMNLKSGLANYNQKAFDWNPKRRFKFTIATWKFDLA